ncbi:5-methylthioadenosine/S-adenosylhomocysteine deaminase [Desulfobotulus alkaliphilus]|uniref:5-methylthioadenosine/S-adenosylhomocysteine deaminase n=1 Tax=Desulfobotulus alkaliphilus TaxID=622671 RepID=A0A562S3I9_9BACT|nr:amidohydrolase [Desulfobotulus alkaliphilus]TWI75344.1 5-methylthioadenosine/S-adenosylhomocysteine deaminase [Desulfobotulus alkaliphilus]
MQADILIENGWILTMDPENTVFEKGSLAITGESISAIGRAEDLSHIRAREKVDAGGCIVLPGLVNVHTHASMTLFRGLADDLPLMRWLEDHIFPAEARLTPELVRLGAELACLEMMASGTTTFCDMYLFENSVAEAADAAGMRAVVGEVLYDFPSPCYGPIEKGFLHVEEMADRWKDHPRITIALKPHSPYLCAPELLCRAFDMAEAHNLPFVIHLAETAAETETIKKRYGRSPLAHLADLGVLSKRTLAAHCVKMDEADIALFATKGSAVAHNPQSNMKLASGIAPVPAFLKAGITVGLGTDGAASNNDLNILSEMRSAALLHKVNMEDPTVLDARTILRMATIDGAKCLGLDGITGSLERGKQADVILMDTGKPHMTPLHNPFSQVVYAAGRNDIRDIFVAGKGIYRNRCHTTLDANDICHRVREAVAGFHKKV